MKSVKNDITVSIAAKMLGVCEETVKRKLRIGEFPNAYKETNKHRWRIPISDLIDYKKHFKN
ncbi:helix-turn-helix domain-containing protein [Bacillus haimaensis]|uniref:helix-turn-helix domain-containing protein n=1 Tax=Bacillus haimaensis TaxID=3160967 RepID=UPI003AA8B8DB